jgi:ribonuclease HI
MQDFVAYVDGSSHGNPGPAGIGVVITDSKGRKATLARWIGRQDNNVAEYVALLEALQFALAKRARSLHVFTDSLIVVKQMTGVYTCRTAPLHSLNWTCRKLARSLTFTIAHVPRHENSEANKLANDAVHKRRRTERFITVPALV